MIHRLLAVLIFVIVNRVGFVSVVLKIDCHKILSRRKLRKTYISWRVASFASTRQIFDPSATPIESNMNELD